jgi:hypothetical protein
MFICNGFSWYEEKGFINFVKNAPYQSVWNVIVETFWMTDSVLYKDHEWKRLPVTEEKLVAWISEWKDAPKNLCSFDSSTMAIQS